MPHEEPAVLEARFDDAMMEIYERASNEVGYRATRYLQMLRRLGGIATARKLLRTKATSEGYARLREAERLDLTVEAYVLRPEFQPLFTRQELDRASDRLDAFGRMMESADQIDVDPALVSLLEEAERADPGVRVELHRDRVVAFGPSAIPAMIGWVRAGYSPGFAVAVIEAIGMSGDKPTALRALVRLRALAPAWSAVIDNAIQRTKARQG